MLTQLLEKLEARFTKFRGPTTSSTGWLTTEQRTILRRDVERMEAVVSVQKHAGFAVLEEVRGELAEGQLNGLVMADAFRWRGPRGLEAKGIVVGLRAAALPKLVQVVIERGAVAQRLLHEDDETRRMAGQRRPIRI